MRHLTLTAFFVTLFGLFTNAQPGAGVANETAGRGGNERSVRGAEDTAVLFGGRITGDVIDNKGDALEAVTLTLLHAGDSIRVKETVSNKGGHFVFSDVADGKYMIVAT